VQKLDLLDHLVGTKQERLGDRIETLKRTLIEESAIVALVCVVFLLHVRSALVAIITPPLGVLIAYLCMHLLGLSSNIMSLGGRLQAN
jgi:copper/silver efflux system protein